MGKAESRGTRNAGRRKAAVRFGRCAHLEQLEPRTLLSSGPLNVSGTGYPLAGRVPLDSGTRSVPDTTAADLVAATATTPGELALHFTLQDFGFQQQADGTQQIVSTGLAGGGNVGDPALPGELVRLALPMDTDLSTVKLVPQSSQGTVVPGVDNLAPVPMPQTTDANGQPVDGVSAAGIVNGKDMAVYAQDAYYGLPVTTLASTQQMGRWKIAEIYYSPFQYNPVTGTLQVTQDATLTLEYQGGDPLPAALANDTIWDASAAQIIANPADAALWYTTDTAQATAPTTITTAGQASASDAPGASSVTANYVIITTAAIQAGSTKLAAFVANQQARGFTVAVETESAWGGGTGNTAADNIRNWLEANYVSMGIQYVLLVGNPDPTAGDVPMKMTWPRYQESSDQQAATDYYYAALTCNWDANGDGKYGEWGADFTTVPLPEVTVGRIPVYNGDYASLDSILSKTIAYENDTNTAWRQSMLLPMGMSNYYNEYSSGEPRTDGSALATYIQSDLATPKGYSTYTLFEKSGVLPSTATCNAPLTEANLVNQWSTTPYGIVDWWGHGNTTGSYRWVWNADSNSNNVPDPGELSFTQFFTTSDTSSLSNSHPSIVVQVSCDNGDPQYSTNLGYALLEQGAVATFCSSAVSWYSLGAWQPSVGMSYGDNASYAYYITKQLTSTPFGATVGAALQWTRTNLGTGWGDSSWMNVVDTNLYGDPSLYLFPPAQIQGNVANDVNGNGVRDAGELGLSGQTVFLDDNNNGKLDSGTTTLASGTVNLGIPDYGKGTLTATQALSGVPGAITNVNVTVNITHTWDSDLTATLISPGGTQIQLFNRVGNNGHNFTNTVLSDAGTTAIASGTAPFTGTFRPAQPLAGLDGQSANGTWQLYIVDNAAGNVGTLNSWTLSIGTAERSTTTDANGNYAFNNLLAGTYHVRLLPQSGWTDTSPSTGEQDVTLSGGQIAAGVSFLSGNYPPPTIVVGSHLLLPNTPNQTIPIYVSGGAPVEGLNFYIQVGDGGVPAGGTDVGPVIQSVDIATGTIFQNNHTALIETDPSDQIPMFEGEDTTTASGTVNATGLLGTVTIDTTGFFGIHTWALKMSNTCNGSTNFAGIAANITNGTITTDSPPVANPDAIAVLQGGTSTVLVGGATSLLANDTDADLPNDTLAVATTPVVAPSHGTLVLHADGTFSYTDDGSANLTDSFVYRISDDAGETATATVSITITPVNHAPQGAMNTVTTLENVPYAFHVADFGFTDPNDTPPNNFLAVKISTLPGTGVLSDNGTAVTLGQFVNVADVTAGKLVFTPTAHTSGASYASFTFQVEDDGGTLNGGVNLDPTPRTMGLSVTWVNQPPQGASNAVTTLENVPYAFHVADFGLTDPNDTPPNNFLAVKISTLPGTGVLSDNGTAVTLGQFVNATDVTAGKLVFTPTAHTSGASYASFTFQVEDDGGTLNGGVNLDPTPRTMGLSVTWVNQPPQGANNAVTTLENTAYTFAAGDFGFTDPNDTSPNSLLAVKIIALPTAGTLADNAVAVTAGQFVSASDISNGKLAFTPATHASGAGYAVFTFQVQDNGGTLNGGVDLDPTPKTMTVNVTYVPGVVGRYVFYNDSAWNGYASASSASDDAAIATDKTALLPGQVATFANYTSYTGGINGVMVDIEPGGNHAALAAADFQFAMGNDNSPGNWPAAPAPESITVRPGAGVNGSDRVTLIWPDYFAPDQYSDSPNPNGIGDTWLQITVRADSNTGLLQSDVFYFGNAVGESGNSTTDATVNVSDEVGARNNPRWFLNPATITDPYDYNRDQKVDATDEIIARDHPTYFNNALKLITAPGSAGSGVPAPGGAGGGGGSNGANVPQISVGNQILLTNTPNQVITLWVSGGEAIQGLNLNVQIGDGGVPAGGSSAGPVIQSVDILTGTIFQSDNTGVRDVDRTGGVDQVPMFDGSETTTDSGTVNATGLLATVTIDTTGFFDPQTFALHLAATANGPTNFAGIPADLLDGTITLERPPVWNGPDNSKWSAASSWLGGIGPQGGDNVSFAASGTVNSVNDLPVDTALASMTFQGGDVTVSGNEVLIGPRDSIGIRQTAGNTQVDLPIKLAAASTVLVSGGQIGFMGPIDTRGYALAIENDTASAVRLDGPVSGGGSLTTTGGGTVVLSGTNTYTGGTVVTSGTLIVAGASALPAGMSLTIGSGSSAPAANSPAAVASPAIAASTLPVPTAAIASAGTIVTGVIPVPKPAVASPSPVIAATPAIYAYGPRPALRVVPSRIAATLQALDAVFARYEP